VQLLVRKTNNIGADVIQKVFVVGRHQHGHLRGDCAGGDVLLQPLYALQVLRTAS
jgi:hypothetical protein